MERILEKYFSFASSGSIELPGVSADLLWGRIADIDNWPSLLNGVSSVERLSGNGKSKATADFSQAEGPDSSSSSAELCKGWRFRTGRIVRTRNGEETGVRFIMDWSVTDVVDNGPTELRSFTLFSTNMTGNAFVILSTWTVEPGTEFDDHDTLDEEERARRQRLGCRLTIYRSFLPQKAVIILGRVVCPCEYKKKAMEAISGDLNDVAKSFHIPQPYNIF